MLRVNQISNVFRTQMVFVLDKRAQFLRSVLIILAMNLD